MTGVSDGPGVGFEERRDLSHVLGVVVRPADVEALRAAQGPAFARLVRLGEALLEVLLVRHRASGGAVPEGEPDVARLLPQLDAAPPARDLLHAAVAAGHRSASWSGVRAVVSRLLSEQAGPEPALPKAFSPEQAADAGRAVLLAAALLLQLARHPDGAPDPALPDVGTDRLAEVGRVLVIRGEQAAVESALPLLR